MLSRRDGDHCGAMALVLSVEGSGDLLLRTWIRHGKAMAPGVRSLPATS